MTDWPIAAALVAALAGKHLRSDSHGGQPAPKRPPEPGLPFDLTIKGLRIPFVAAWEFESPDIRHDSTVRAEAIWCGEKDHREAAASGQLGRVLLGQMAPQRQRLCMVKKLCQVCGEMMKGHGVMLGQIAERGPDHTLCVDEPLCCASCAAVAIEQCPYAKAAFAERGALLVRKWKLLNQMVEIRKGDSRDICRNGIPLDRATFRRWMGKPLVMHVRMMPTEFDVVEPGDMSAIGRASEVVK